MKKYFIIALNQLTVKLQYKFNIAVIFISRTIPIFMFYFIWNNIYNSMNENKIGNYDKNQMLTYIILVNLTGFLFTFDHIRELGKMVQRGTLSTLLLRPVSFIRNSFSVFMGKKFFLIIIYLSVIIFLGFTGYFKSNVYFLKILIFIILCIIMFFHMISFISTIAFWLVEIWPVNLIIGGVYSLFSGAYFPLDLLPENIYNGIKYNPFSLIGYISIRSVQGAFSDRQMSICIIFAIIWTIIFRIGYEKSFKTGLKKYEGTGA